MPPSEPPPNNTPAQSFPSKPKGTVTSIAIRLAAVEDEKLKLALASIVGELAKALGATQVALLSIASSLQVTCEAEYSAAGDPTFSHWLSSLVSTDQQLLISALEECSFDRDSSNLSFDGLGQSRFLAGSVLHTEGSRELVALILKLPKPLTVTIEWKHYLQEVLELLAQVFGRLASERTSAEQRRQLNSAAIVGRAAVALAHDFNNVLYTIQCVTDVLQLETDRASRTFSDLEEIKNAAHRGASLTRHLVTLSSKRSILVECINLGDMLNRSLPIVQRILGPHITLRLELPRQPLQTMADRATLERWLLEAILDMRPRSAAPHSLGIAVRLSSAAWVELVIATDNDDAFWEFPNPPGYESHNSRFVHLVGTSEHTDTQLRLRLPLYNAPLEPEAITGTGEPFLPRDATLLIVEDEETARKSTARILSRVGYRVLEANGHQQAVGILTDSAHSISVLITDVVLPDGSGVSLYDHLRSSRSSGKAVFISGFGPGILREHGLTGNDFSFLQKPYRASDLQSLLVKILSSTPSPTEG